LSYDLVFSASPFVCCANYLLALTTCSRRFLWLRSSAGCAMIACTTGAGRSRCVVTWPTTAGARRRKRRRGL